MIHIVVIIIIYHHAIVEVIEYRYRHHSLGVNATKHGEGGKKIVRIR